MREEYYVSLENGDVIQVGDEVRTQRSNSFAVYYEWERVPMSAVGVVYSKWAHSRVRRKKTRQVGS